MSTTYDSYEAKVVQAVLNMLATSATFKALVGASTAAQALAFMVESWGGNPSQNSRSTPQFTAADGSAQSLVPPFAQVHLTDLPSTSIGVGVWEHNGSVRIDLLIQRTVGSEKPPESFRRARNVVGGIRADLEAMFGTTVNGVAALARGSIQVEAPDLPPDASADGDAFSAALIIDFEG